MPPRADLEFIQDALDQISLLTERLETQQRETLKEIRAWEVAITLKMQALFSEVADGV